MMDTPNCPTCSKPMEPNPAHYNETGPCTGMYGQPGDPAFVCLTEDAAHDAARITRLAQAKVLLEDATRLRTEREAKAVAASKIGAKENPTAARMEE